MRITSVRHLDGPNLYIYKPILMARMELEELTNQETVEFEGFSDKLLQLLPGLHEHHCAKGRPGGFVERLYGGTYFGHVVEHTAIELATLCGLDIHYGKTVYVGPDGVYDIIIECREFPCQKLLLERAQDLVQALLDGAIPMPIGEILGEAESVLARTALGPSTKAIVDEALSKGIPVWRRGNGSFVQLGWGRERKLIEATITQNTSALAVDIACDKQMTKSILYDSGVPVPDGGIAYDEDEAVSEFRLFHGPVVVKPLDGNQGRGVSLNLTTDEEVREAYRTAAIYCRKVIVERHIPGRNLRCLVVDGKFVAASERLPAMVYGDGESTVEALINRANSDPLRGNGHEKPLTKIIVDDVVRYTLRKQGLSLQSVVACGERILLRESANLSTGGQAIDVTDEVPDAIRLVAERAARVIGLDVCGIDMVVSDDQPLGEVNNCYVIEVNAAPGIRMHHHPSFGSPRPVAQAIINSLFGPHRNGRIPIVSITGTNGKTTTTRLIAHVLGDTGKTVGMTTTSGVWIDGRQIAEGDMTGPASARMVLSDPAVEVAVLETARGGIVRGGLAYDKANVAVLTNITPDHLGQDGIDTVEDLMHVKSLVGECVSEDGTVVLNADDPRLVSLSTRFRAKITYFAMSEKNPVLCRHLALGGTGFYTSGGWLIEARGNLTWQIMPVGEVPITMGGTAGFQVENTLAAVSALRAMGCTRQQIARGMSSFQASANNPGRCTVFQLPSGAHVIIDYGHNPDGFRRVGEWLKRVPHNRLKGVVGVPGDRNNTMIRESAAQAAEIFDELYVKEDVDKRGRTPGEVAELFRVEINKHAPHKPVYVVLAETEALSKAMQTAVQGDIVVLFYERLKAAEQTVLAAGGVVTEAPFRVVSQSVALPL
ncbi:cyanophycin synthetase [Alicyclobacillus ferrooxydans]|uniref:Cyanophycin synthetase n=1 Tax=Alicyclobacillus ferrooxydans TaxID=471514 RepID=A0A0P9EZX7_9BACL|nr:cyanophycin synthetase [Alicyclobacillus ferrooxydans]KPV44643.1 cyanophycin synthetase [Alicyclobacillus ferrooxydans]